MTSPELTLPVHPTLLHPRTGEPLMAAGVLPSGRVVWPVMGGDGTEGDANDGDAGGDDGGQDDTGSDDSGTGDNGDQDGGQDDTGAGQDADEDGRIKRANRQAQTYRNKARDAEKARDEAQAVIDRLRTALDPDDTTDEVDAGKLADQVESLTRETNDLRRELLVHDLAGEAGADAARLLDSRSFTNSLRELDSEAADYHDQVARAIKAAVDKNDNLRTGRESGGRGGAEGAGAGRGGNQGVTAEQFKAMSYAERTELYRKNPDLYRRLAAGGS